MSRIVWDALGERIYEVGLDHGVLYLPGTDDEDDDDDYRIGIPWNGLTKVTDPELTEEASPLYSGGIIVANEYQQGAFTGSIEAYTYPDEFERCLGYIDYYPGIRFGQQDVSQFGLSYRTLIGSGDEGTSKGYKIHLLYNCRVKKAEKSYATIGDSLDIEPMSWDYEAFPYFQSEDDQSPLYHIVINSLNVPRKLLRHLEDILYGTDDLDPRLLSPDELIEEHYQYYDIWTAFPSPAIYPHRSIIPAMPPEERSHEYK